MPSKQVYDHLLVLFQNECTHWSIREFPAWQPVERTEASSLFFRVLIKIPLHLFSLFFLIVHSNGSHMVLRGPSFYRFGLWLVRRPSYSAPQQEQNKSNKRRVKIDYKINRDCKLERNTTYQSNIWFDTWQGFPQANHGHPGMQLLWPTIHLSNNEHNEISYTRMHLVLDRTIYNINEFTQWYWTKKRQVANVKIACMLPGLILSFESNCFWGGEETQVWNIIV